MTRPIRSALVLAAAAASLAACGGGDDDPAGSAAKKSDGGPVTIEWWHIQNNPPMKDIWADAVQAYQADHPNVKINVTVVTTIEQAKKATLALSQGPGGIVSVFAGRLADLGIDYVPLVETAVKEARATKQVEVIWASTREVWNVIEADRMGCHIITAPADILKKLTALGTKTAEDLALDGVKAFRSDTLAAGLTLNAPVRRTAAE